MTTPVTAPNRSSSVATTLFESHPPLALHVSAAVLGSALLLGVAGDALLRDGPTGIGFPVWIALVVMTFVSLAWRADLAIPRESAAWLGVAAVFAACVAWRNSEILRFFDLVAVLGAVGLACASMNRAGSVLFAPRLLDSVVALVPIARTGLKGFVPLASQQLSAHEGKFQTGKRLVAVGKVVVIAGSLILLFGSLLRSADPIFASVFRMPSLDVETIASHAIAIGILTWGAAGLSRGALIEKPSTRVPFDVVPFRLGALEVTTTLVTLNVLFAAFVAAQLGWFFGGEDFLRARTGLTASAYARQGFFQMVWVVLLVVPLLVATRTMLQPGRALARRHTLLSLPVTGLLGAIVVSALLRMRLYVGYYGLSTDRFYPLVFMCWLGVVLVWLALTVLRGWGRPFIGGAAISGLVTLLGLNIAAPERIIARVNIERAARSASADGSNLDILYLSHLGGEAADLVTAAVLADRRPIDGENAAANAEQRCWSATNLLRQWGPESHASKRRDSRTAWRAWNAGEAVGLKALDTHGAELRAMADAACVKIANPPREYQNTQR